MQISFSALYTGIILGKQFEIYKMDSDTQEEVTQKSV